MTTDFVLVVLIGVFILGAVIKNYYILWFFAGITCWGLGAWWVYDPLVAGGSPVNDIMLTIAFLGGIGLMFMMSWQTRTVNGREVSGFNIRLPRILGGKSEDEELTERQNSARTWSDRRESYKERLEGAIKGRRLPPR